MTKFFALAIVLLSVAACSADAQYPQMLQTTMAQALPPYHAVGQAPAPPSN